MNITAIPRRITTHTRYAWEKYATMNRKGMNEITKDRQGAVGECHRRHTFSPMNHVGKNMTYALRVT